MKTFRIIAGAGLLIAMASPSFGADLPRPAYKAPMYSPAPAFSWSGFYVGINGGYGWGTSRVNFPATGVTTGNFDVKGGLVGGTLGYNLQAGSIVYGIEGDLDASWIKGESAPVAAGGIEVRNRWLGTVRGRVGYAFDRFLPYVTGGAAFGNIRSTTLLGRDDDTKVGWTLGAGLEYAFLGAWSAKVEYLYVRLSDADCGAAVCGAAADVRFRTNMVRAGLNYRF